MVRWRLRTQSSNFEFRNCYLNFLGNICQGFFTPFSRDRIPLFTPFLKDKSQIIPFDKDKNFIRTKR